MFIDSHAHVDDKRYDEDREIVLERAIETGVELILEVCNGDIENGSLDNGIKLIDKYSYVYGAVGIHPHDAKSYNKEIEAKLRDLCQHPKVIAWGEIGLDFYYNHSPQDVQEKVLMRQMELASEYNLPIILHIRDAEETIIPLLQKYWSTTKLAGIFHCFSGSQKLADVGLDLDFLISFSGNLTFKKSDTLRNIAANIPLKNLLLETDCPYLTPEPHRGKRNEPAYVSQVAKQLAELHKTSVELVGQTTTENFYKFFKL